MQDFMHEKLQVNAETAPSRPELCKNTQNGTSEIRLANNNNNDDV